MCVGGGGDTLQMTLYSKLVGNSDKAGDAAAEIYNRTGISTHPQEKDVVVEISLSGGFRYVDEYPNWSVLTAG